MTDLGANAPGRASSRVKRQLYFVLGRSNQTIKDTRLIQCTKYRAHVFVLVFNPRPAHAAASGVYDMRREGKSEGGGCMVLVFLVFLPPGAIHVVPVTASLNR